MFEEHEKEIRARVDAFKAEGKTLGRGDYTVCLIGVLGGVASAERLIGYNEALALEFGFEGWKNGRAAKLFPQYHALGKKIAEENGL